MKRIFRIATISLVSPMLGLLVAGRVSALTYQQNVGVNFTFNSSVSLSLSAADLIISSLDPGTAADSNIITVSILTNSLSGYTLNATVGNDTTFNTRNLIHSDTTQTANFGSVDFATTPTISTNSALSPNTWAYSYSTDDGTTWANYNGLPLWSDTTNIATLKDSNDPIGDSTGDAIKFKIAAKADAAQLAGTYNNVINFTLVAKPTPTTLAMAYADAGKELYNGYYKMQDMTASICNAVEVEGEPLQVIDIRDGSVYTIDKLAGACWMTQNLRITGDIVAADSNFHTNSTFNPCVGDLTAGNSYNEARCHDSGSTETGVWYNYASASAGTITGSSNDTRAAEDICPAGWHLPGYDTTKPAGSVNSLLDLPDKDYFSPVTGGRYLDGTIGLTGYGYWWSSVAYNTVGRYYLNYNGSSLGTNNNSRFGGRYIRCVNDNSTSSKLYMQDQTQSSLATLMPNVGDEVTLYDSRDEKAYTVAHLADGNYWMTQNLDHNIVTTAGYYTPQNTDIPAAWTPSTATYATDTTTWDTGTTGYTIPQSYDPGELCWDGTINEDWDGTLDNETTACGSDKHMHIGNYYNWTAAVAMNDSSSYTAGNTDVDQSICPAGWRLPIGGTTNTGTKSFTYLWNQYSSTFNDSTMMNSPLYFSYAGYWYGLSDSVGSHGFYWSSVVYDSLDAYGLGFEIDYGVGPQDVDDRTYGNSVRCVAR